MVELRLSDVRRAEGVEQSPLGVPILKQGSILIGRLARRYGLRRAHFGGESQLGQVAQADEPASSQTLYVKRQQCSDL